MDVPRAAEGIEGREQIRSLLRCSRPGGVVGAGQKKAARERRPNSCSPFYTAANVSRRGRRAVGLLPRQRPWAASEALGQSPSALHRARQQNDLAIGELERVMMDVRRAIVDLAKDRDGVAVFGTKHEGGLIFDGRLDFDRP